jgi:hypothetical protein
MKPWPHRTLAAPTWLPRLGPKVLLIPRTSWLRRVEENMAVATMKLDPEARASPGMVGGGVTRFW